MNELEPQARSARGAGRVKRSTDSAMPGRTAGGNGRDDEPAYVLHAYPFKETSLVVEVFSRNFGRLGLVARGARRPRSALRGLLMAFQPLSLDWAGKSELRTLHRAERLAGHAQLAGMSLMCGFYLNELLLKLVPREDPHEGLYLAYEAALQLAQRSAPCLDAAPLRKGTAARGRLRVAARS